MSSLGRRSLIGSCGLVVVAATALGQEYETLHSKTRDGALDVAFSPDGVFLTGTGLVAGGDNGHVTIWRLDDREVSWRLADFPTQCGYVDYTRDGQLLAVGCGDRSVHVLRRKLLRRKPVWERIARLPRSRLPGDRLIITDCVQFSPDGTLLACSHYGGDLTTRRMRSLGVQIWETDGFRAPIRTLHPTGDIVTGLRFVDEGRSVLIFQPEHAQPSLLKVNVQTGEIEGTLEVPGSISGGHTGIDVSADASRCVIGWESDLFLVDAETMEIERKFRTRGSPQPDVEDVAFHPDGQVIATAESDHNIRLWDVETGDLIAERHHELPHCVEFSPDGAILATAGLAPDGVRLWDVKKLRGEQPGEQVE